MVANILVDIVVSLVTIINRTLFFLSLQGKCQRKDPPCKYLHPPQHLREQLLQNGKNNLILKNLQMQAMAAGLVPVGAPVGLMPAVSIFVWNLQNVHSSGALILI